jgi:hypothetical protein
MPLWPQQTHGQDSLPPSSSAQHTAAVPMESATAKAAKRKKDAARMTEI